MAESLWSPAPAAAWAKHLQRLCPLRRRRGFDRATRKGALAEETAAEVRPKVAGHDHFVGCLPPADDPEMVDRVVKEWGHIDILMNNAA